MSDWLGSALNYTALGWGLCSIPPGTKGPTADGWNTPEHWLTTEEQVRAVAQRYPANGWGLVHAASGTCCVDVDHAEHFRTCLAEFGLTPEDVFADAPRIIGRDGRDKALFRVPAGVTLKTHKLVWPPRSAGEKPLTVFELRAGAVQDVLPPTIHPDTGMPYRWRNGEPTEPLPELPPELLSMWQSWDTFKQQMMAVCTWAPKPPSPKPRVRSVSRHGNVIGQFNQAHDVAAILAAHGYVPRGRRWLSPTSSSNLAGVVIFEDGTHCYSHHASDPLNDGHAHDAFDVFCLLDHGGEMGAAVASAAQILGLDNQQPEAVPVADIQSLIANVKARKAAPDLAALPQMENAPPSDLLTIPGVLGKLVNYANRTAPKPQPQFAVQAALALGSAVLGRRWCTTQDNYAAQYYVNIGKSASGKEHGRTVVDRVLTEAKLDHLIGPSGYTSDSAVFSHLHHKPTHLALIDELGAMLGNAKAQGNFHKRQALDALTQAWGLLAGSYRPQGYSTMSLTAQQRAEMQNKVVHRPSLTLLGMTTPRTFYGSLTEQAIEGGFLNRLLIVESHLPPRVRGKAERIPIPPAVIDWCARASAPSNGGNLAGVSLAPDMIPEPAIVGFSADAETMFGQYEAECIEEIKALEAEGLAEMQGRSCEKAQRLALVAAVSVDPERPLITGPIAQWAIRYVRHYTEQTIDAIRQHMHGTQFAMWRADVLEGIRKGGAKGRTESELARQCRPFAGLEPRLRRSVLDSLKADGLAQFVDMGKGPGGRGKSRLAWIALKDAPVEGADDAA